MLPVPMNQDMKKRTAESAVMHITGEDSAAMTPSSLSSSSSSKALASQLMDRVLGDGLETQVEAMLLEISNAFKHGYEDELDKALATYIRTKEDEIKRIASSGYRSFVRSARDINVLKNEALKQKTKLIQLNKQINNEGRAHLLKIDQEELHQQAARATAMKQNVQRVKVKVKRLLFNSEQCISDGQYYLGLQAALKAQRLIQKKLKYAARNAREELVPDIQDVVDRIKQLLIDGVTTWSKTMRAISMQLGEALIKGKHIHIGKCEVSEPPLSQYTASTDRISGKTSSSFNHRAQPSIGTSSSLSINLTPVKQFFYGFELLGLTNEAQQVYQHLRISELRETCLDFALRSGSSEIDSMEMHALSAFERAKLRNEQMRGKISKVCRRLSAVYWLEDIVHERVSSSLIPLELLCRRWDESMRNFLTQWAQITTGVNAGSSSSSEDIASAETKEEEEEVCDPKLLTSIDTSTLGLYFCASRMSFLTGPVGHARCVLLYRSVTSEEHVDVFLHHVVNSMQLKITEALSQPKRSFKRKYAVSNVEAFRTLIVPYGLQRKSDDTELMAEDVPCTMAYSTVVPLLCNFIHMGVEQCRRHGTLVLQSVASEVAAAAGMESKGGSASAVNNTDAFVAGVSTSFVGSHHIGTEHTMRMHSKSLHVVEEGFRQAQERLEDIIHSIDDHIHGSSGAVNVKDANSPVRSSASSSTSHSTNSTNSTKHLTTRTIRLLCQITSDSAALAHACRAFGDELLRRSLDQEDRSSLLRLTKIEQRLVGHSTDAQVRMHEDLTDHIDSLMTTVVDYTEEWGAREVRGKARPGMDIVVEELNMLLSFSHDLAPIQRHLTHMVAMRHICERMVSEIEDVASRDRRKHRITTPAICNFSSDVALLEQYSASCNVENLKEVFAEPRQLCNLLLSGHIETILDDDIRSEFYPSVSINLLVRVLTRHKAVKSGESKLQSMMTRLFTSKSTDTSTTTTTTTKTTETNSNNNKTKARSDTMNSEIGGDPTTLELPPPMTEKEAGALALRIERKLLNQGPGQHGTTYAV